MNMPLMNELTCWLTPPPPPPDAGVVVVVAALTFCPPPLDDVVEFELEHTSSLPPTMLIPLFGLLFCVFITIFHSNN